MEEAETARCAEVGSSEREREMAVPGPRDSGESSGFEIVRRDPGKPGTRRSALQEDHANDERYRGEDPEHRPERGQLPVLSAVRASAVSDLRHSELLSARETLPFLRHRADVRYSIRLFVIEVQVRNREFPCAGVCLGGL